VPELSEWLQLMLAEIARKADDADRSRAEEELRNQETTRAGDSLTLQRKH